VEFLRFSDWLSLTSDSSFFFAAGFYPPVKIGGR